MGIYPMKKIKTVKVRVSRIREFLGSPSWYLWSKCSKELGLGPKIRTLTIPQTKLVLGWFFLHARHKEDRTPDKCLIAYYAGMATGSKAIVPVMSGREILDQPNRPSDATLYRRGLRVSKSYNPEEVEKLIRR